MYLSELQLPLLVETRMVKGFIINRGVYPMSLQFEKSIYFALMSTNDTTYMN